MDTIELPSLNNVFSLNKNNIEEFRTKGHTLTKSVLQKDEAAAYRTAINDAAYKFNTEKRKLEERDTYGKAFLQIMNLWQVDKDVKKFTLAKRFA